MKNIKWHDHVKNKEILRLDEEKCSMVNTILKRQRQWAGYLLRKYSFEGKKPKEEQGRNFQTTCLMATHTTK